MTKASGHFAWPEFVLGSLVWDAWAWWEFVDFQPHEKGYNDSSQLIKRCQSSQINHMILQLIKYTDLFFYTNNTSLTIIVAKVKSVPYMIPKASFTCFIKIRLQVWGGQGETLQSEFLLFIHEGWSEKLKKHLKSLTAL